LEKGGPALRKAIRGHDSIKKKKKIKKYGLSPLSRSPAFGNDSMQHLGGLYATNVIFISFIILKSHSVHKFLFFRMPFSSKTAQGAKVGGDGNPFLHTLGKHSFFCNQPGSAMLLHKPLRIAFRPHILHSLFAML
jgi:hypothetical protein